ncbi:MAG: hypothetical protein IJN16_06995 [Lachnospiraceae bacterium]|nr:hypothetical protein [Lachnospiraceae bacterium]
MAAKKTTVDKTPIEVAIEETAAPVEKKACAKRTCKTKAVKAAEQEVVKEEAPAKKAPAKKAAKKEVKAEISVQYAGKSYSNEDLMQIAKDVWRFDLKQKVTDLVSVELYVKPEENMVYYVFNGTESGSFAI